MPSDKWWFWGKTRTIAIKYHFFFRKSVLFQSVKADGLLPQYQIEDDFNTRVKRGNTEKTKDPTCLNINGRLICLKRECFKYWKHLQAGNYNYSYVGVSLRISDFFWRTLFATSIGHQYASFRTSIWKNPDLQFF